MVAAVTARIASTPKTPTHTVGASIFAIIVVVTIIVIMTIIIARHRWWGTQAVNVASALLESSWLQTLSSRCPVCCLGHLCQIDLLLVLYVCPHSSFGFVCYSNSMLKESPYNRRIIMTTIIGNNIRYFTGRIKSKPGRGGEGDGWPAVSLHRI